MDDVAEHALTDFLRIDLGAGNRFADDAGGEVGRRNVLETSAVVADGRADAAQNNNFSSFTHDGSPGDSLQ